jgi:hypothetical protein
VPHFEGRVLQSNGTPRQGGVITVSDPKSGEPRATVISAADGRFSTNLPRGTYAVTATTPDQSIYLATLDGSLPVEIRLDAACTTLIGRIDSSRPLVAGSIIKLTRSSEAFGDRFAAISSMDGTFQACLPPAMYAVEPPAPHVKRDAFVVMPHTGTFVYRTAAREDADRARVDLGGLLPQAPAAFAAEFPATTRVLGLGETNHGSGEFYDERTNLALELATKHGVRLLMLEAGVRRDTRGRRLRQWSEDRHRARRPAARLLDLGHQDVPPHARCDPRVQHATPLRQADPRDRHRRAG